jgi:hypothetical protein
MTIFFENSPGVQLMLSNMKQTWVKNFVTPEEAEKLAKAQAAAAKAGGGAGFGKPAPGARPRGRS